MSLQRVIFPNSSFSYNLGYSSQYPYEFPGRDRNFSKAEIELLTNKSIMVNPKRMIMSRPEKIDSLGKNNDILQRMNDSLKKENDSLEKENNSVKKDNETLRRENAALKQSQASSKLRQLAMNSAAIDTTQKLENMQNRIDALERQQESTIIRHIPNHIRHSQSVFGPKNIYPSDFAEYLKRLDLRPPGGLWDWKNAKWQFHVYSLWQCTNFRYLLRPGQKPRCTGRKRQRDSYDYRSSDPFKPVSLLWYGEEIMELEVRKHPSSEISNILPKYVLHLGDLFVVHPRINGENGEHDAPYESSMNNLSIVMDVCKPSKSLWLVYKNHIHDDGFYPDREAFPKIRVDFDLALILEDIHDWDEPKRWSNLPYLDSLKVVESMRRTACRAEPVFIRPVLDDVLQTIEDGWAGYEDRQGQ